MWNQAWERGGDNKEEQTEGVQRRTPGLHATGRGRKGEGRERRRRSEKHNLLFGRPSSLQRDIFLLEDLLLHTPNSGEISYDPGACFR